MCVRKISSELTSDANLPLFFLRKIDPGLTSVHIFLYFIWDAATAWPDKQCVGARLGSEPGLPAAEDAHLTTMPWGQPGNIF